MTREDKIRHAEKLTVAPATASDVSAIVDPLFREYGEWVAGRLEQDVGSSRPPVAPHPTLRFRLAFTNRDHDDHSPGAPSPVKATC